MYHADLIGGIVVRLSGIRTICWGIHHSVLVRGASPFSTILVAKVCALLSGIVPRVIICCSQEAIVVHKSMGYRADKMICIPNGYDISKFNTDPEKRKKIREEIGIKEEISLLGMVARYDPLKDHENLLNALCILKRTGVIFKCVLVGTGMDDTNQKIKEQIRERALEREVLLLGRRNDIPALMNALDLHILSSSSEAFPNVLAEAMACGTPCVATDVGDAAIIVGDTGWIVPPKEPEALAGAITKAINEHVTEPERWSRRSAGARERIAENFGIATFLKRYQQCWREII
ncbi:D-inositol-3-phosphate glycosyltransferase [bioreactor metagenome]|uniref:D-inositol-3-phosphate glycosyltransferase n=1 Tax=bioreactor metagenome TaxID=1076179 RepID=A0A644YMQ5_9ZZZZ